MAAMAQSRFELAQASSPEFVADPYPTYDRVRELDPICEQPDGSFFLSRYDDVRLALTDASRFSSDKRVDFKPRLGDSALYEHHTTSLVFNDPPTHTRVRKLLGPFFAAQTMRGLEHRVRDIVKDLLDQIAERGRVDLLARFALAIPLAVVGDLLGVPVDEREPLRRWANLILGGLEVSQTGEALAQANQAVEDFKHYLRELIAYKRRHPPRDDQLDVLWALIRAHDAADLPEPLSELEILHNAIFLLNAGHDTTTSLICNGVDLLLRHPDQLQRLRDDRALLKSAIEEMLRLESPLQIGNRRAGVAVEFQGRRLSAGSFLHLGIAAANRDPRQFADPGSFDVAREPNRHLAFGHGIHFCAGNAVARMEAMIAFAGLLDRFPTWRRISEPKRPPRARFRVVDEFWVEFVG